MVKKYLLFIPLLIMIFLIISIWKFPSATPVLGILLLLAGLAMPIFGIFEKHKDSENPRLKITKDVLILVITFLLIIFLGGLVGLFANYHMSQRFGTVAGFVAAVVSSFLVGYFVKKGVGKVIKQ